MKVPLLCLALLSSTVANEPSSAETKASEEAMENEQRKWERLEAERERLNKDASHGFFEVLSITPEGLLGTMSFWDASQRKHLKTAEIFVETDTKGRKYVTGQKVKFSLIRAGNYTYQTVLGAEKTVEKYRNVELILSDFKRALEPQSSGGQS